MKNIKIFYTEEMNVEIKFASPSPGKPKVVVKQWLENYSDLIKITSFNPIKPEQFYLVHQKQHVDNILSCKRRNGLGTTHKELAQSLVWTTGSFLEAAKYALNNEVAVSPTSGFHHANYEKAHGYCTFNGLMVAARVLLLEGLTKKVGIFDCDMHYGDGTIDIINKLGLSDQVIHLTANRDYPYEANYFLEQMPYLLESFKDCDIIFYQAGADPHIDDPYGGFLTSEQLRLRDRIVFNYCKINKIPIVWNLAGGYQEDKLSDGSISIQKVLDIHNATMEECIKVYIDIEKTPAQK